MTQFYSAVHKNTRHEEKDFIKHHCSKTIVPFSEHLEEKVIALTKYSIFFRMNY